MVVTGCRSIRFGGNTFSSCCLVITLYSLPYHQSAFSRRIEWVYKKYLVLQFKSVKDDFQQTWIMTTEDGDICK